MINLPAALQELIAQFGDLTVPEQRERHLVVMKHMLDHATYQQACALRGITRRCYLCEWLGEEHREAVLDMIEGHLALRRMRLISRREVDEWA